ncbi:MAG TPA: hypothetical protein VK363_00095 [Pyrinomonadaceae bacterium]|nr:hypothetical protein [Pyrinomonadaceae bacterium]
MAEEAEKKSIPDTHNWAKIIEDARLASESLFGFHTDEPEPLGDYIITEQDYVNFLYNVGKRQEREKVFRVGDWKDRFRGMEQRASALNFKMNLGSKVHRVHVGTSSQPTDYEAVQQSTPATDATIRVLIKLAIGDVERAREVMERDEEEIQRLKQQTRAILDKLAA